MDVYVLNIFFFTLGFLFYRDCVKLDDRIVVIVSDLKGFGFN